MRSTFWMSAQETEDEITKREQVTKELERKAKRNANRKAMDQLKRDCGLVKGRDSMNRVIWE